MMDKSIVTKYIEIGMINKVMIFVAVYLSLNGFLFFGYPALAGNPPVGGCFGAGNTCAKGLCCTCDARDPITKNCIGGSSASSCTSCNNLTVDTIKCGKAECNQGTQVCCPSGCKSKDEGCPVAPSSCVDTTWGPDTNTVCAGKVFNQTSNCGKVRKTKGENSELCGICTEIKFAVPEGESGWKDVDLSELSSKVKVGSQIKMYFTALSTSQVQAKVNEEAWSETKKNTSTGKYEFVYTIPKSGTFKVEARYLSDK